MKSSTLALFALGLLVAPSVGALPVTVPLPQDDAGSGGDAGETPATAVPVEPGVVYDGILTGAFTSDDGDWYSFDAPAGVMIHARLDALDGCLRIHDAAGTQIAVSCLPAAYLGENVIRHRIDQAGRYHLSYSFVEPDSYSLSFAFDGTAPDPRESVIAAIGDDAGSGSDAGDVPEDAMPIESGVVYRGTGGSFLGIPEDVRDWYRFEATAGARIQVRVQAQYDCVHLHRPDGTDAAFTCSVGAQELSILELVADATGTWRLNHSFVEWQSYWFSIGVDEGAPTPLVETRPFALTADRDEDQNDAGSGRDAGESRAAALPIESGVAYRGRATLTDDDWYSFEAIAGQRIRVDALASFTCVRLYGPEGEEVDYECWAAYAYKEEDIDWTADVTGTWYVEVQTIYPDSYAFSLGVDSEPAAIAPPVV